jgi:hypothetical protein
VQLFEAKDWLRITWTDEDVRLQELITRARAFCETVTHRALALQTIQQIETIERPIGGELSGPVNQGPSWYQYQEQLGANPFGAAQFYYDLAMPPAQGSQSYTIETKITAFDPWEVFTQTTIGGETNTYLDDNREPGRLYIMSPITANFYRVTFQAGYDGVTKVIPWDLKHSLMEAIAFFYEHPEASGVTDALLKRLLSHRVDWL